MDSSYSHTEVESKWETFWRQKGFFKADAKSNKPAYSLVLPPPNVTGALHMGHALDDTLQDILSRYKRMNGYEVLWLPGFDHAGISTQTVVEKHLIKTVGKRRSDFEREEFLAHVWEWKEKHEGQIQNQLMKLGCSLDWSRKRFTMDEGASESVRTAFKKLYDKGLIYQGDYLVNWDPATQTALADDEVEYEEHESSMWHFRYPIEGSDESIEIATTRPETMLGDTAVAVNPKDERYTHLVGKQVKLPLVNRLIPIIADDYVDPAFGTGCVKITPAHDFNDYEVGLRHDLEMINIMSPDGLIEVDDFDGLTMLEGRAKVVTEMKAQGFLVKIEPHIHRVGHSYRSKAVIEPYLSKQWFLKMGDFKKEMRALVESEQVKLLPEHYKKTYFHWIDNLRDWCISRQLWWGHRIPVWHHVDSGEMICFEGEGVPPEVAKAPEKWEQDPDVLDTWFSSALWPFSTLGWPHKTADMAKFFPTSILVTGNDILFFWVARMMLMSHLLLDDIPFSETFIHGLIYGKSYWRKDEEGHVHYLPQAERVQYELGATPPKDVESKWEKMSKSKGNIIDPIEVIDSYGADAMRMALCSSITDSRQLDLDRRRFEEYKNFSNKMWNAARFIMMNIESLTAEELSEGLNKDYLTLDDRWILSRLNRLIATVRHRIDTYDFDDTASAIYTFFWDQFCAYYLETSKPYLFGKAGTPTEAKNKQKILLITLTNVIRLLHPITPFITEEIFSILKAKFPKLHFDQPDPYTTDTIEALKAEACTIARYPHVHDDSDISDAIENDFTLLNEVVYTIRNVRGEMQIPPSEHVDISFTHKAGCATTKLIQENQPFIHALVKVQKVEFGETEPSFDHAASGMIGDVKISIPLPANLIAKEKKRLAKESEKIKGQIEALTNKLANKQFVERAPEKLVSETRQNLADLQTKLSEISEKINI